MGLLDRIRESLEQSLAEHEVAGTADRPAPLLLREEQPATTPAPGPTPTPAPLRQTTPAPTVTATPADWAHRLQARFRDRDALREAFVLKEILDRPVGRGRRRYAR